MIYWDDEATPSVIAPLGDFFGLVHSLSASYASLPLSVSAKDPELHTFGGSAALNSYFPMPFAQRARVVVENENDVPYRQYFYIDYELSPEPLPDGHRLLPRRTGGARSPAGWGPDLQVNSPETTSPTSTAPTTTSCWRPRAAATTSGCNLSVPHFQGTWWGEGDDMIFVDDDTWPPSLHGTGTEDYFSHAWGMQRNAYPFNGTIVHEGDVPGYHDSYRFHLADPVRFEQRIRVTIEHGHGNHLADDWSSTAYWYQTLPSPVLPCRTSRSGCRCGPSTGSSRRRSRRCPTSRRPRGRRPERMAVRRRPGRAPRGTPREVDGWERGNGEQARAIRRAYDRGRDMRPQLHFTAESAGSTIPTA